MLLTAPVRAPSAAARHVVAVAVLAAVAACGPGGGAPRLQPIEDRVVAVNQEVVILLAATDDDGDELSYSFKSDVPDIQGAPASPRCPLGAGEFR